MTESHLKLIDPSKPHRKVPASGHQLPLPLQQLREQSLTFFAEKLATCFEQVDDTFFDLADRAENNTEQAGYFDAMRLIRIGRKTIEQRFAEELASAFNQLSDADYHGRAKTSGNEDVDELEVLDNEALEETIATEAMASKVSGRCKDVLNNLVARIDFMVPATVTAHNNPLGPEIICHALRDACGNLEITVRCKLVFFKLIDRHLIDAMNDWLNVANDRLRDVGVLPDLEKRQRAREMAKKANRLRSMSARQNASASSPSRAAAQPEGSALSNTEISEESALINQLQAGLTQSSAGGAGTGVGAGSGDGVVSGGLPPLGIDDLVSLVTQLQGHRVDAGNADESMLGLIQSHLQSQGNQVLRGRDQSVVQVLDGLFSHIQKQPELLGNGFGQQLRRLEMPILRIALRDGAFFDQQEHPARQLLNQITDVAVGYKDESDIQSDTLGRAVKDVIDQLNQQETVDNSALTELLLGFIALVEKERRRVLMMEQRIVDEVAASEKVNLAHRHVKTLLNNRMKGRRLPKALVAFAQEAWCRVLFMAHLKFGRDSNQWKTAVKTFDHLLYFCIKDGMPLAKARPVVETARQRLQDIAYDPHKLNRLIAGMEEYLNWRHGRSVQDGAGSDKSAAKTADSSQELVDVEQLSADLPGESGSDTEENPNIDDDYLNMADSLGRGAWVDYIDQQSDTHRCKVAGIISPPGKYIFVNRQGAKVAEISRYEIAKRIKDKQLVVLDSGQVFDRALQHVIQGIREQRQTA